MAMATTAGAALRLRLLCRMLRVGELLAITAVVSWSSSRVPSAAAAVVRLGGSLLLDPRFVFVLGNAIVLLILALSRRDPSLPSSSSSSSNAQTPTAPAAVGFPSFTAPAPPPAAATEALAPAQVVVAPVAVPAAALTAASEVDKPAVCVVSEARAPRRSRSEKMRPRGATRRAALPELRRSESDNGRRRRSSATARDTQGGGGRWAGMDDAEEFRRTVEAFIARQTRFHREEESVSVAVAVQGTVAAPATAELLAAVE